MTQEVPIPSVLWEPYIHVKTALIHEDKLSERDGRHSEHNTRTIWKEVCSNDVAGKAIPYNKVKEALEILRGEGLVRHNSKPTGFNDDSVEHIWAVIDFDTFVDNHKEKMKNEYLHQRFQHNL